MPQPVEREHGPRDRRTHLAQGDRVGHRARHRAASRAPARGMPPSATHPEELLVRFQPERTEDSASSSTDSRHAWRARARAALSAASWLQIFSRSSGPISNPESRNWLSAMATSLSAILQASNLGLRIDMRPWSPSPVVQQVGHQDDFKRLHILRRSSRAHRPDKAYEPAEPGPTHHRVSGRRPLRARCPTLPHRANVLSEKRFGSPHDSPHEPVARNPTTWPDARQAAGPTATRRPAPSRPQPDPPGACPSDQPGRSPAWRGVDARPTLSVSCT